MLIHVQISGHLKDYTGRQNNLEMTDVATVFQLVEKLNEKFPGIKERIFDDQERTRLFVNIFLNGDSIRELDGEKTTLEDGDIVRILPSVAGGFA
ncbi:MAG: MoaD family protein [Nitrososphaerota archaeon]|nr:MoaD family protein [Nitrososphaerota archaeon]